MRGMSGALAFRLLRHQPDHLEPEHFVRETENYQCGTDRGQLRTDPTVIASQEPEVSGKLLHGE